MVEGIQENGSEDADKVARSVLAERHAREVGDLEQRCVLVMMYKFNTGMLPDVLNNMFTRTNTIHNIATRQTDMLHVNFCM